MNPNDIQPHQWINVRDIGPKAPQKREPTVDVAASKIVGHKILNTDPKLMKWVGDKVKAHKDSDKPLNLLKSEKNRQELKKLYA